MSTTQRSKKSSNATFCCKVEEENQGILVNEAFTNKKTKVRSEPEAVVVKAQESLQQQQMDNLAADGMTLNSYYGSRQNVQGLIQLNLINDQGQNCP